MPINSKQKGARGERMFRDECREAGFTECRRTQQYCGGTEDSADVMGLPGISIEVKFVEKLNINEAMEQSMKDAIDSGVGAIPIVAHKKSRKPWLVTMKSDDWFKLYKVWLKGAGIDGYQSDSGEDESQTSID